MNRVILFALWLTLLNAFGCAESPITTIDRSSDCAAICDRYRDCFSSEYDTDHCRDRCTDKKDSRNTDKIDRCQDCIRESSCSGSVFKCSAECIGIVP
jgi:hypothetical protein